MGISKVSKVCFFLTEGLSQKYLNVSINKTVVSFQVYLLASW